MSPLSKKQVVIGLIVWLVVTFILAAIGSIASIDSATFYKELIRPEWAPPSWLFGPVWSILYLLMGIAAWLVWRVRGFSAARIPLTSYLIQLIFNTLWTWLFFAWHKGGLAFIDIIILWVMIIFTILSFWRIKPLAGVLLIPYLLWVSFAAALNYTLWQLNPGLLN